MVNFDEYWRQYKKVPMYCKPTLEWLENLADDALVGSMTLNENQKVRLFTAIRDTAKICKRCECPEPVKDEHLRKSKSF